MSADAPTRSAGQPIRTQYLNKFSENSEHRNLTSADAPTRSAGQPIRSEPTKCQNLEISTGFRFTLDLLI